MPSPLLRFLLPLPCHCGDRVSPCHVTLTTPAPILAIFTTRTPYTARAYSQSRARAKLACVCVLVCVCVCVCLSASVAITVSADSESRAGGKPAAMFE